MSKNVTLACPKALPPEPQYLANREVTSKDSYISICASFKVYSEPQIIDFQITLFLDMLLDGIKELMKYQKNV